MVQQNDLIESVNTDSMELSEKRKQWFSQIKQNGKDSTKVNTDFLTNANVETSRTALNFAESIGVISSQDKAYIGGNLMQAHYIKQDNEQEYNDFIESLSDSNREEYEKYNRYMNGTYTDQDKSSLDRFSISGTRKVQSSVMDKFNIFFRDENNVSNSRTIELGKKTFDTIKKMCSDDILNKLIVKNSTNSSNVSVTIPRDKEVFAKFAKAYNDGNGQGLFRDGASTFLNHIGIGIDYGQILNDAGIMINNSNQRYNEIMEQQSTYMVPLKSMFPKDIIYVGDYELYSTGKISKEKYKERLAVTDNILESVLGADLTQYKVYANKEDVEVSDATDYGSSGVLREITNMGNGKDKNKSSRNTIYNHIKTAINQGDKGLKISFGDVDGLGYGTIIEIPANSNNKEGTLHGSYTVFVPKLIPSDEAEAFQNAPEHIAASEVGVWNAQHRSNIGHTINFGDNELTQKVKAFGNDSYTWNGVPMRKEDIIYLKTASYYLDDLKRNIYLTGNAEESARYEQGIRNWLYNDGDNNSLISVLSYYTNKSEAQIENILMEEIKKYLPR